MKQKTFAIQDSYDVVKYLDEIKNSDDYKNASAVLVNIFTERFQKDYISYLTGIVKNSIGKASIAGLTCIFGFSQGEFVKKSTVFTVFFFFESEIEILEYDFSKISVDEAKSSLVSKIDGMLDLKGIQVFTTPLKNNVTNDFLSSVSFEHCEVPIFGAGAGFEPSSAKSGLYIFGDGIYENGVVVTLFRGQNLKIYAESTLGWAPIGKEMVATDVLDKHILKTLDGEIAGDVFKKYLGVTSSDKFFENTCEFPLMFRRGGRWIARIPIEKDESGSVYFTADIQKGEKLMFSYGAKKLIMQQSFKLAEYMSRKNLEGLLLHVCRNRNSYLKEDEQLELQAFSNFYRETAGCFAFAEILYKNNGGGLLNGALVAVGFREFSGGDANPISEDCYVEENFYGKARFVDFNEIDDDLPLNSKNSRIIPFEERLVNFLHATSNDLCFANMKLKEAATTDGLTKIFNRKKISEVISYELKKREKSNALCLIMFDIDNFKKINDTYGHDMGDDVLVRIAATAKGCIRSHDSIGRWGGEEFMVLLPATAKDEAVSIAERIRSSINALQWEKIPSVSVSVGVTSSRPDDDIQTFYKRVDNRLYFAKTHGKNRVVSEDFGI